MTLVPRLAMLGLTATSAAQDPPRLEHVTVEVRSPKDTCYVHERVTLAIHVGVLDDFLRANLLQPFRRQLDVPVRVEADWWDGLPGVLAADEAPPSAGGQDGGSTFVLNDGLTRGVLVQDPDRPGFTVLEVARDFFVQQAGGQVVPGPTLRASWATRFRDDFVQGRVPVDRREIVVQGDPLVLTVRPLPEAGRPPEFGGAVGRFTVRAEAQPRELRVGQSLKLVIEIEGEGDLTRFEPPRLEASGGFHVYGIVEDRGLDHRRWTCDLAPLHAGVSEVPAIPFAYFDPTPPAGYRTTRTRPIPLDVLPSPEGEPGLPGSDEAAVPEDALRDIHGPMPVGPRVSRGGAARPTTAALVAALLLPWLLAAGLWSWLRVRAGTPDRAETAVRQAAHAFRQQAARPEADLATAFAGYLAVRLQCPAAAVIAPELRARLRAAGVADELAERSSELLDELLAARFGGRPPAAAADRTVALVGALENEFAAAEGRR